LQVTNYGVLKALHEEGKPQARRIFSSLQGNRSVESFGRGEPIQRLLSLLQSSFRYSKEEINSRPNIIPSFHQ
jgi:hypothetical protein